MLFVTPLATQTLSGCQPHREHRGWIHPASAAANPIPNSSAPSYSHGANQFLAEQLERFHTQPASRLRDPGTPGNFDSATRASQPLKAFQHTAQDFPVVHLHEDCQGNDVVKNQIRRQVPSAALLSRSARRVPWTSSQAYSLDCTPASGSLDRYHLQQYVQPPEISQPYAPQRRKRKPAIGPAAVPGPDPLRL